MHCDFVNEMKTPSITSIFLWNFCFFKVNRPLERYKCNTNVWIFPFIYLQMAHQSRRRQNSISDNSTPSSDVSEGSETCEASSTHDWQLDSQNSHSLILDNLDLRLDSLSLENNSVSEVTDSERAQIESFFSGLGTEVSFMHKT